MPARLAVEIRRRSGRSSLGSFSGLAEGAEEAAEALRTDEEGFELHRSAALRALDVDIEATFQKFTPRSPSRARLVCTMSIGSGGGG
jgi:hypothetical protein